MINSKVAIVVSQIIEKIEFIVGILAIILGTFCAIMNVISPKGVKRL